MANSWTPGPWPITRTGDGKRITVGRGLVEGPNGYEVAEVYSDDCDQSEAEANARLIAHAPEMAEALDAIAAPDALLDANPDVFGQHAARRMQEQARALLSRIRGETGGQ